MTAPTKPTTIEERLENIAQAVLILEDKTDALAAYVRSLLKFEAEVRIQIMNLTEQTAVPTQKPADDGYLHLRRIIKVIALTDLVPPQCGPDVLDELGPENWEAMCDELYRRWGHLTMPDGTPLWSEPPTVSDTTKAMVRKALERRQGGRSPSVFLPRRT